MHENAVQSPEQCLPVLKPTLLKMDHPPEDENDPNIERQQVGWSAYCDQCSREIFVRNRGDAPLDGGHLECHRCGQACPAEPEYAYYRRVSVRHVRCLLCGEELSSAYLNEQIEDDKAYLLACMVTHYRHTHVKYYNNSVGYASRYHDYAEFKELVNERAKRQIIRKARDRLRALGIRSAHFRMLEHSDPETIALAEQKLDAALPA